MARPRQPIDLVVAKGKKNLTKAEIEERKKNEVKANSDSVVAPAYLPENLKNEFDRIANELLKIKIMSNLDCEALARFIVAESQYQKVTEQMLRLKGFGTRYLDLLELQEKFFKMSRTAAGDLGLTISSRAKLVVPTAKEDKPQNKFSKFM